MRLVPALTFIFGLVIYAAPVGAQAREACLHAGTLETPAEARRRDDALALARMINTIAVNRVPNRSPAYLTWQEMAGSPQVAALRGAGGPAGDLARRVQWGADEPLPGWAIHYVVSDDGYAFSL